MITLACIQCYLALRTSGEFDEVDYLVGMKSEWYPDRYPCPRPGCMGQMTLTDVLEGKVLEKLEVHDLTPQECFHALNGLGLPEERECTPEAVTVALQGRMIQTMELQPLMNDKRTVLRSITLDDGTRVYLGSSPQGALIYRIAPVHSQTNTVLDGH